MKKRIFSIGCLLLIPLLFVLLVGCSATIGGKSFDYSQVPKIEKGKTTQQDIQKMFGEPLNVRKTDTGEVWSYHVSEVGPIFNPTRSLDIYFDKSGVVTDYTYKEEKKIF